MYVFKYGIVGILIIFISCQMKTSKQSNLDQIREELNTVSSYVQNGHISSAIGDKIRKYIEEGNVIDVADWLYFAQNDFYNERNINVKGLLAYRNEEIEISISTILDKLKKAGFFKRENSSIKEKSLKILRKELVEYSAEIARKDSEKTLMIDLEADVCMSNEMYIHFINELETISNNKLSVENIKEIWESETGPIELSFEIEGKKFTCNPEFNNDWLDGGFIEIINNS